MSTDRDTARIVRSWLEEGVTALPDRVLDAVLDQVPAAPQRRSLRAPRRFDPMQRFTLAATAAAATLVVTIVAYNLLVLTGGPAARATPAPTPTSIPTATSAPSDAAVATVPPPSRAFTVADPFPMTVRLTLPTSWVPGVHNASHFDFTGGGPGNPYVGLFLVDAVYVDPCHSEYGTFTDRTVGPYFYLNLSSDLRALRGFSGGFANTTMISGHVTEHFTIQNDIDTSTAGCSKGDLLPLFRTEDGEDVSTNGGTTQEMWILSDVDTRHLLVVGDLGSHPAPGDQELIQAIVESIRL